MNFYKNLELEWYVLEPDEKKVALLVRSVGVSDPLARVLVNRGLTSPESAKSFLNPSLEDLRNPFEIPGMEEAAERLVRALNKGERIAIYGDYDVDGITSTALLRNFLAEHTSETMCYTPDRLEEGYGLHVKGVERLREGGASVLVTVDVGIADAEAVETAQSYGMDVLVIDHHQPPPALPKAPVLVDPHVRDDSGYFKCLSAAGLTFYLLIALRAKLRNLGKYNHSKEPNLRLDMDLAALGTIADMAPLIGPNRVIAYYGLKELSAERRPGISALKKVSGLYRKKVTSGNVSFQLAPRINAAGRMGDASIAVELFTTKDANRADEIARQLEALNTQRQEIENKIMNDAIKQIERKELFNQSAIVVGGRDWHQGVIGIIASKITEIYGLPSIVVSLAGDTSKGSARSINGVNIFHAISECSDLLVSFGGHEMAAGIVVSEKRLREFNEKFLAIVKKTSEGLKKTGLQIDAELDIEEDFDGKLAEELQQLSPHGIGNPEPLFKSSEVTAIEPKIIKESHLKFRVKTKREGQVEAIGFDMAGMVEMLQKPVDIAYFPRLSEEGKLGLIIKGIKPSGDKGGNFS